MTHEDIMNLIDTYVASCEEYTNTQTCSSTTYKQLEQNMYAARYCIENALYLYKGDKQ